MAACKGDLFGGPEFPKKVATASEFTSQWTLTAGFCRLDMPVLFCCHCPRWPSHDEQLTLYLLKHAPMFDVQDYKSSVVGAMRSIMA